MYLKNIKLWNFRKFGDNGEYDINKPNLKDCIDFKKAEVKRFKSSGKIMRFIKYAFKEEVIKNESIFKCKRTFRDNGKSARTWISY